MEDTLQQLFTKLSTEWAPAALDMGAQIMFWTGMQNIGSGCILLSVTGFCLKASAHWRKRYHETNDYEYVMTASVLLCVAGLSTLFSAFYLLDIWNWIALYNPQLALAHDVYTKVIK